MQRKVIQLAGKTFVVSLPSKWAKKHNIKKSQELEVVESNKGLLITPLPFEKESSRVCLDVSGLNSSLVWHYLVSAYVNCADEVELRFSDVEIFNPRTNGKVDVVKFVSGVVDSLVGMELVRHGNNFCIIKEVSSAKCGEFDAVLKRLFFNVCTFSADCLDAVKKNDVLTLRNCGYFEQNVNRLFIFCSRLLNKGVFDKYCDSSAHHVLVCCLEEIADALSSIANLFCVGKISVKEKSKYVMILEQVNTVLHNSYGLFYDFEKRKCIAAYDDCVALKALINSAMSNSNDSVLLHLFGLIEEKSRNIIGARIGLSI